MSDVAVGSPNEAALPLPDIAKRLPISESKLRSLVRDGTIPSTRIGKLYYLFPSDVQRVLGLGPLHAMEPAELTQALGEVEWLKTQILARLNPTPTPAAVPGERTSEWRLTARDVMERTGMSRSWLYRANPTLPFARQIGRSWRYSEKGLERYMNQRQVA